MDRRTSAPSPSGVSLLSTVLTIDLDTRAAVMVCEAVKKEGTVVVLLVLGLVVTSGARSRFDTLL